MHGRLTPLARVIMEKPFRERLGTLRLSVRGNSMAPTLLPGDQVLVDTSQEFGVGDIVVAALAEGAYVVHRVVSVDKRLDRITTRGDANLTGQVEVFGREDILGRVVKIYVQ